MVGNVEGFGKNWQVCGKRARTRRRGRGGGRNREVVGISMIEGVRREDEDG